MKKWTLIAALSLFAVACGASQSNRSDNAFRCSLAELNEDAGAAKMCLDDCAAGEADACATLGYMHMRGHMVPQSHADALKFSDRACELRDPLGCYEAGRLRTRDDDQRVRVSSFERVCLDDEFTVRVHKEFACYESATAYLNGFGVPVDRDRGAQLAQKACRAGSLRACAGDFSSAPIYADSGNTSTPAEAPIREAIDGPAERADVSRGNPGMLLNIGKMEADGLTLRDLSCEGVKSGLGSGLMIVGLLSKQKPALDACNSTKDVSLAWTVERSAMSNAEATSEEAEAAACVQKVLAATPMPDGDCTATLPPQ